jgi:hypothetical protein
METTIVLLAIIFVAGGVVPLFCNAFARNKVVVWGL